MSCRQSCPSSTQGRDDTSEIITNEKHKSIGNLHVSGTELKQKISDLSAKREALLAELKPVEEALTQAKQEES